MRRLWAALAAVLLVVGACGPASAEGPETERPAGSFPIPPEPAPFVASGRTLTVSPAGPYRAPGEALAAAQPGDTVEIRSGVYVGHWTVSVPVRLVGVGRPVLDGGGEGTVLRVEAPRVEVTGLVLRGTGDDLSQEDAAIVVTAPGADIHDNWIDDALFGIYLRQADHARLVGNEIRGMAETLGLRGDGIRLWYSPVSLVESNQVIDGRDVMVWFSDRSVVRHNTMTGGRYGLHFMWSNEGLVEENRLDENSVGIFVMYSDQVTVRRNTVRYNRGPSGYGLALKDAEMMTAEQNWLAGNRVGLYLDNSPYSRGAWNHFDRNVVAGNDVGLLFMPATHDDRFTANDFIDNGQQVHLTTEGNLGENEWSGNYWSDYAGYDADGDGRGDLPYASVSLFEDLLEKYPAFGWFRHSPAAAAVDLAAKAFPAVAPAPLMAEPAPAMAPLGAGGFLPAGETGAPGGLAVAGASMLVAAAVLVVWLARGRRWRGYDSVRRRREAVR